MESLQTLGLVASLGQAIQMPVLCPMSELTVMPALPRILAARKVSFAYTAKRPWLVSSSVGNARFLPCAATRSPVETSGAKKTGAIQRIAIQAVLRWCRGCCIAPRTVARAGALGWLVFAIK